MMPKIRYIDWKPKAATLTVVGQANAIIDELRAQGYTLTLRQLYYQFVAKDLIENTERSYKRLGEMIGKARLAGMIDWSAIEDRGRELVEIPSWDSPASIIDSAAQSYRFPMWRDQPYQVEVWVEKQALAGVVESICTKWRVPSFACKGYPSLSSVWEAGARRLSQDKTVVIIHLGDHDPSGIDMTYDIMKRLDIFHGYVRVERVALNMGQVEEFKPPPNPAKVTDSRFAAYAKAYGTNSWELDALNPATLDKIISAEIEKHVDMDAWERDLANEDKYREQLAYVRDHWTDLLDSVGQ